MAARDFQRMASMAGSLLLDGGNAAFPATKTAFAAPQKTPPKTAVRATRPQKGLK